MDSYCVTHTLPPLTSNFVLIAAATTSTLPFLSSIPQPSSLVVPSSPANTIAQVSSLTPLSVLSPPVIAPVFSYLPQYPSLYQYPLHFPSAGSVIPYVPGPAHLLVVPPFPPVSFFPPAVTNPLANVFSISTMFSEYQYLDAP